MADDQAPSRSDQDFSKSLERFRVTNCSPAPQVGGPGVKACVSLQRLSDDQERQICLSFDPSEAEKMVKILLDSGSAGYIGAKKGKTFGAGGAT